MLCCFSLRTPTIMILQQIFQQIVTNLPTQMISFCFLFTFYGLGCREVIIALWLTLHPTGHVEISWWRHCGLDMSAGARHRCIMMHSQGQEGFIYTLNCMCVYNKKPHIQLVYDADIDTPSVSINVAMLKSGLLTTPHFFITKILVLSSVSVSSQRIRTNNGWFKRTPVSSSPQKKKSDWDFNLDP